MTGPSLQYREILISAFFFSRFARVYISLFICSWPGPLNQVPIASLTLVPLPASPTRGGSGILSPRAAVSFMKLWCFISSLSVFFFCLFLHLRVFSCASHFHRSFGSFYLLQGSSGRLFLFFRSVSSVVLRLNWDVYTKIRGMSFFLFRSTRPIPRLCHSFGCCRSRTGREGIRFWRDCSFCRVQNAFVRNPLNPGSLPRGCPCWCRWRK